MGASDVCVQSCNDGPVACCRIFSAVVACILLFTGIVMQMWAGTHVDDVPLSTLCQTYSGSGEVNGQNEFLALSAWYRQTSGCEATATCDGSYSGVASFFLSSLPNGGSRTDLFRYAPLAFYCKNVPSQYSIKATDKTCFNNPPSSRFPCRLYPNQPDSGSDANWLIAEGASSFGPIRHVNCAEKQRVFEDYLEAIFGTTATRKDSWTLDNIKVASGEFYRTCVIDKGNNGYILNCGPIIAIVGGVITTLTMFKKFHGPPWPEVGINLLVLSLILILFGFWSISIGTVSEISEYAICGEAQAPVAFRGIRYDGRPCVDRDSVGEKAWNPFIYMLSLVYSTYVVGGGLTFISIILFLGLVTGFTETMMGEKFGKYLVSLNDLPGKIRLPFPADNGLRAA